MRQPLSANAVLALVTVIAAELSTTATADETTSERHSWNEISYPALPCPWATKAVVPSLGPRVDDKSGGLELRLTFTRPGPFRDPEAKDEFVEPETDRIEARLHLPNGEMAAPQKDSPLDGILIWVGGALGSTATLHQVFPWQNNVFDEAWIELRFPDHVYWLEVPYGFTRNPSDSLCKAEPKGRPKFAPAMKSLEKSARIVNWKYVEYGLTVNGQDRSATLRQSNPFDARCELVLYKGDFKGWDLFHPRTSVAIEQSSDRTLVGDCISIAKHDDGLRRSDRFKFNRNPAGDDRCWGSITVKMGDQQMKTVVPSSLFKYVHGVADPYHKATIRD